MKNTFVAGLLVAAAILVPVAALATTVDDIVQSPSTFDGQHVDVSGTIEAVRERTSHKGNPYVTFSLCSDKCIHVFSFGTPVLGNGQTITVHGTFKAVKHIAGYTFYDEIDADDGSL